MSSSVLYFTAGPVPTSAELAEIAVLNGIAAAPYTVAVRNGKPRASVTLKTVAAVASDNSYTDAGATITAGTISAAASDNSLNDSGNGFLNAGFAAGDYVSVSGFSGAGATANIITNAKVLSVTAAKMILDPGDGAVLVDDAATESVTITAGARFIKAGFKAGDHVMVRGYTGNVANNVDDVVVTSVTATKLIIGGTDGNVIANDAADGETVTICTVDDSVLYGAGLEVADYIAGTVPEAYKSAGTAIYTVLDPASPPDFPTLPSDMNAVENGDTLALDTDGTVTFAVALGVLSGELADAEAVVTNGGTVAVVNSAGTATDDAVAAVASNLVTNVALPANKTVVQAADTTTISGKGIALAVGSGALGVATFSAVTDAALSNGATVAVVNSAGTATDNATAAVAVNAVTNVALPATKTVVENTDNLTLDGVSVPLVVSAGALAAATLIASGSTSKVITSGVEILASGVITTKVTVTIVDGVITACVGG